MDVISCCCLVRVLQRKLLTQFELPGSASFKYTGLHAPSDIQRESLGLWKAGSMSDNYYYEACIVAGRFAMNDEIEVLVSKSYIIRTLRELSSHL